MRIEEDKKIFAYAQLFNAIEDGSGTKLLCEYWQNTGKLEKLLLLLQKSGGGICCRNDELQYLIAAEDRCENVHESLSTILRPPYCLETGKTGVSDAEIRAETDRLVNALEKLSSLRMKSGWSDFYAELSRVTAETQRCIDKILALHASGKKLYFRANCTADDILSGAVNFRTKSGKFFLVEG